jgi:hypothetical protein
VTTEEIAARSDVGQARPITIGKTTATTQS